MFYRVFVDACLLYPPSPRSLILGAAAAGAAAFSTSEQVLDEVHRHLATRIAGLADRRVQEIADVLQSAATGSVVDLDHAHAPAHSPLGLPDPDDEHVAAGALAAHADGVLTLNRKDFPEELLIRVGLDLVDVDQFFHEGLKSGDPRWRDAVRLALTFPPAGVTTSSDLGMALSSFGLERTAGVLLSAAW